ncbi:MAG TPA: hypothetical protein VN783_00260 [Thermoanaerobaculia bacterium]|nr:hypothetical protein [Thermoanaerobaculia bacterium]
MILYRPTDGDVYTTPIRWRPKTAFLMAQLGGAVPPVVGEIRQRVESVLGENGYELVDADSVTTGKDFLLKIWQLVLSTPVGIAIVHEGISSSTMSNIFYELGWMQAYGKETIVVKAGNAAIPSDFVRTEYVPFDGNFDRRLRSFMKELTDRAEYYAIVAEQVERNPLLAIDYFRRAFLLTDDESLRERAREIYSASGLKDRAKNSVETLLTSFAENR